MIFWLKYLKVYTVEEINLYPLGSNAVAVLGSAFISFSCTVFETDVSLCSTQYGMVVRFDTEALAACCGWRGTLLISQAIEMHYLIPCNQTISMICAIVLASTSIDTDIPRRWAFYHLVIWFLDLSLACPLFIIIGRRDSTLGFQVLSCPG